MPEHLCKRISKDGFHSYFYFITFRLVIKNSEIWPQKRRSTISVHQFKCLVHFFLEKIQFFMVHMKSLLQQQKLYLVNVCSIFQLASSFQNCNSEIKKDPLESRRVEKVVQGKNQGNFLMKNVFNLRRIPVNKVRKNPIQEINASELCLELQNICPYQPS